MAPPIQRRLASLLCSCWLGIVAAMLITTSVRARIVDIAVSDDGTFLLTDNGEVWAFKDPYNLKQPYRMPGLKHIVSLQKFAALGPDGNLFTWADHRGLRGQQARGA